MILTSQMVYEKTFTERQNSYDRHEVDDFLDQVCDTIDYLNRENEELKKELRMKAEAVPAAPIAVPAPTDLPAPAVLNNQHADSEEASIGAQKLLMKAQKLYDELTDEAKAEAEEILRTAREKASQSVADLEEKQARLTKEVDALKETARDYKERFQRLLDDQQHILNSENELFE